ncbi:uncharacterized protein [Musca autumnalis]|uniref:uncharacterized protein n=1 Tax=Musca autumnalis TaxID=221902 RepID=UPI003CEADE3E
MNTPSTSSEVAKRIRSPEEQDTVMPTKKKKSSTSLNVSSAPRQEARKGDCSENLLAEGDKVSSNAKRVCPAAKSTAVSGDSAKKSRTRQKRKRAAETGREPPSYANVAKKRYRDELCYAVIDTNRGSGKLPKDHLPAIEERVNNKILHHIMNGGDPIQIISSGVKGDVMVF